MGGRWFLTIFAVFWTSGVLLGDLVVGAGIINGLRAQSFATTTGTITHSEVTRSSGSRGKTTSGVDIRYSYEVDNQVLQGETSGYAMEVSSSESDWAQAAVDAHAVGSQVTVYYDPSNPAHSLLKPGVDGSNLMALLFLTPFNVVMLAFFKYGGSAALHWWNGTKPNPVNWFHRHNALHLRLAHTTPIESGFIGAAAAAFVLTFVGAFAFSFRPSIEVAAVLWALVVGAGIASVFWMQRRLDAGEYDLVLGDRTVEVPAARRRRPRVSIERASITGVTVEEVAGEADKSTGGVYRVVIQRRNGPPVIAAKDYDNAGATALAAWLREKLRLPHTV